MAECVLDANVLVAWIDAADSLHGRARDLMARLERAGTEPVLLDVLIGETISVLCRRFRERRQGAGLAPILADLRQRLDPSAITWVGGEVQRVFPEILELVSTTEGRINFNDALLAVLQREGRIGAVASFDAGFDHVAGFIRVS